MEFARICFGVTDQFGVIVIFSLVHKAVACMDLGVEPTSDVILGYLGHVEQVLVVRSACRSTKFDKAEWYRLYRSVTLFLGFVISSESLRSDVN